MIVKTLDIVKSNDVRLKAGYESEKQMAFYLDRKFGKSDDIFIINGIRLNQDGDVCQIDHLVIHEFGMVIIESKSVYSKVKINNDGSWERLVNNTSQGMKSPVLQAQRQAEFIRNYLNIQKKQLLNKVFGIQYSFNKMPIEIIVAISDNGIIDRSTHDENCYVYKADQVTDQVNKIYLEQKRLNNPLTLTLKSPGWVYSKKSLQRVIKFLIKNHCPAYNQTESSNIPTSYIHPQKNKSSQIQETQAIYKQIKKVKECQKCGKQMIIRSGYNYYWKCKSCNSNEPINEKCQHCNQKAKISKAKTKYFIYCKQCSFKELYYDASRE